MNAASRIFWAWIIWLRSAICAPGQIPQITPLITPTVPSLIPKSVINEITDIVVLTLLKIYVSLGYTGAAVQTAEHGRWTRGPAAPSPDRTAGSGSGHS